MSKDIVKQRKEIARDVLKQLRVERYISTPGRYLDLRSGNKHPLYPTDGSLFRGVGEETEVNVVLREKVKECRVCAIGAVFLSALDKHDKLKCSTATDEVNISDDYFMLEYLSPWFTEKQMRTMESAFEVSDSDINADIGAFVDSLDEGVAIVWGAQYGDATERMRQIMKKIVNSEDGLFHPEEDILFAEHGKVFMLNGWLYIDCNHLPGVEDPGFVRKLSDTIQRTKARDTVVKHEFDSFSMSVGSEGITFDCINGDIYSPRKGLVRALNAVASSWEAQI